jgi:death-on-curing protein
LLESALSKPKNLFAYGALTLAKLAASYAAGIILNHPFLDGNKRTGFLLAATFLELNGLTFNATEESVVEATLALAAGKLTQARYAEWLDKNSIKS